MASHPQALACPAKPKSDDTVGPKGKENPDIQAA
jgi:hypothetical protein